MPAKTFQSIQLISHGSAGSLLLGSSTVTGGNLSTYSSQLAAMGHALTDTGDILLYGCNVAAELTGLQFINRFAELTGAEVAASDDVTGGLGDWQLEAATGGIESTSAINAATLQSYDGRLAIPVVNATAGVTPVEGKTAGTFTVSLDSPAPAGGLTVNYSLAGTAVLTADYTVSAGSNVTAVTGGSFTVAEGQSSATLVVNAVGDGVVDGGETIFLNLSTGTGYQLAIGDTLFAPQVDYAATNAGYSVNNGDFNGDGKLDLVTSVGDVLLRNATNTGFDAKVDYTTGDEGRDVTVGDFNADGRLDFAITNPGSSTVSVVLRNTANTGFDTKTDYPTDSPPHYISAGDFNNDGKTDLAVTNHGNGTVSVLLRNAGNTGFDATVAYMVGTNPFSVSVGDFNDDGKLDLATANQGNDTVSVFLRNVSNTGFDAKADYTTGNGPTSISFGDFNNDGKTDLAVANHYSNTVSVLSRSTNNGNFDTKADYATATEPFTISSGDFNNDGQLDLAIANYDRSKPISVLIRNAANTGFEPRIDYSIASGYGYSISTGDFNNDGKKDLAFFSGDGANKTVSVLLNNYTPTSATLSITDTPQNTPPTLSSTTTTTFTEQTPITLSNTLTLNDPDGDTSWNNGTLKLQITANNTANNTASDSLLLPTTNNGSIWLNTTGNLLMNNTTAIGTTDAATVSNDSLWTITFNAAATNALVQDTARAIQFTNNSDAPSTAARTVTFTATDNNGGTGSATQTINITAVNDVPAATNKTITFNEDSSYSFSAADFGYADIDGNALASIKITSLPSAGSVKLSGTAVSLNQVIPAASLANLTFTPADNANGANYANFNFTVNDGSTDSVSANTISVNVTAVNDAPSLTAFTSTVASGNEDHEIAVSFVNLQSQGNEADSDGTVDAFVIKAVSSGSLKMGASAGAATAWNATTNNTVDASHNAYWTPASHANGALNAFTVVAKDNGGLESATAIQATLSIAANNAPTGNVSISGDAIKGQTLSAAHNLADADGLGVMSYLWQADNVNLATGNSYVLTDNEVGKIIKVIASYTDGLSHAESVTSVSTAAVTLPVIISAGVSIIGSDFSTSEQGDTALFMVKLNSAPTQDVSITFTSSIVSEGAIITPSLTFTPDNWSSAQALTINGQNDYKDDGDVNYHVAVLVNTIDIDYKFLTIPSINLTNLDDGRDKSLTLSGDKNGMPDEDRLTGLDGNDKLYGLLLPDELKGGMGNDKLYGGYDDDNLYGGEGNDYLYGEQDSDYMDGGAGNDFLYGTNGGLDTMIGGVGNDTYYLDFDGIKDVITDNGLAADVDVVVMPFQIQSYFLPKGIESGKITEGTQGNLTGNTSNNTLTGNSGKNILNGATGKDSLVGGAGNDVLIGGAGNDVLTGGVGKDVFKLNGSLLGNNDKIKDFNAIDDTIQLENAIYTKLISTGVLKATNFIKAAAAQDVDDYVIYNPTTGSVTYDSDGAGAGTGVQIALLGVSLALTHADFVVI